MKYKKKKQKIFLSIRSKTKQSSPTCTFCRECGHRVTNCDKRKNIGNEMDGDTLIEYLENSCPFCVGDMSDVGSIINLMEWKDVRHIKIHVVKSRVNPMNQRPPSSSMYSKISCYGIVGQPINGFSPCYVNLDQIISYIHQHKKEKTRKFFSSIKEESIGPNFLSMTSHCNAVTQIAPTFFDIYPLSQNPNITYTSKFQNDFNSEKKKN